MNRHARCSGPLLAGWFAAAALAQQQPQYPQPQQDPIVPTQQSPGLQYQTNTGYGRYTWPGFENMDSRWSPGPKQEQFGGFPSFNPKLSAYGAGYPRRGGDLAAAGLLPMPVVPPSAEETGWPAWVRAKGKPSLNYAADKALLVRHSDRVWWKAPDEDAFVPLYFYDKLRLIAAGTDIEVRQTGDFELVLHGGSRLASLGRSALRIETLSEQKVELRIGMFTRLRCEASGRETVLLLPDGSSVVIPKDVEEEPVGPAYLVLERAIEPSWFQGRAWLFNGGPRVVQWTHAFGSVPIGPGERVGFFLAPPKTPVPAALAAVDARTKTEGAVLTGVADNAGAVSWSGARFQLKAGGSVRLDPLLGDPFAPPPPQKPAESPAK